MTMVSQNAHEMDMENIIPRDINQTFDQVAKKYHNLKTTDSEMINTIVDKIKKMGHIEAVDVECVTGRYDLLLYRHLGDKLRLTCLDANDEVLKALTNYLAKHDIGNFSVKHTLAETMPFQGNVLDCVCTFNTNLRYRLSRLLNESARVLKSGGYLFIYTKLRQQNEKNIQEQYSPQLPEKETRLYSLGEMKQSIEAVENLAFESVVFFAHSRLAALEESVKRAGSHHRSNFLLYSPEELEEALKGYSVNVKNQFEDPQQVRWFDENVLFVIRKK